ncbi:hypothetical protein TNCV_1768631 [Trichonephila clavipes]|nr:hypothetical protein TNCV_1768631 [Trichonephila clavipes]
MLKCDEAQSPHVGGYGSLEGKMPAQMSFSSLRCNEVRRQKPSCSFKMGDKIIRTPVKRHDPFQRRTTRMSVSVAIRRLAHSKGKVSVSQQLR